MTMRDKAKAEGNAADRSSAQRGLLPGTRPRLGAVRKWFGRLFTTACWGYLAALLGLWGLLAFASDRWWVATVAMYGPRWVWGLPGLPLLLIALLARRRGVWVPLFLAGLVVLFPVMRLCLPWRPLVSRDAASTAQPLSLRVLTCNVDQASLDPRAFAGLLEEVRPDVVACQAWTSRHEQIVFGKERGPGHWYVKRDGELLLASRYPITAAERVLGGPFTAGDGSFARFEVSTPAGAVQVFNIHLASPRDALQAVIAHKWGGRGGVERHVERHVARRGDQSATASRHVAAAGGLALVLGDFNTPADSTVYRRDWSGLTNAFSHAGFGFGNTHFTRRTGVRIDHVLAGDGWRVRRCWVGPNVGSAHRPIIADVELRRAE